MSWMLFSIYALVFALVCGLSYGAMAVLMPNAMTQRMDSMKADVAGKSAPASSAWWGKWWRQTQQMLEWLSPLSSSSEPEDPAQTFRLRLRFYNAGLHSRLAPMVYLASKTALTFALPGVAMLVLWQQSELNVKELGEKLHLDSGTLTPLLKRLENKGLVSRTRSQLDERVVHIHLTEQGKALKNQASHIPVAIFQQSGLPLAQLLELKQSCDLLFQQLDAL